MKKPEPRLATVATIPAAGTPPSRERLAKSLNAPADWKFHRYTPKKITINDQELVVFLPPGWKIEHLSRAAARAWCRKEHRPLAIPKNDRAEFALLIRDASGNVWSPGEEILELLYEADCDTITVFGETDPGIC